MKSMMQNEKMDSTVNAVLSNAIGEWEKLVKCRLNGRVQNFHLIIESDGVVLRGKTRSYYAKQLAQHTVMEVSTLRILANDIQVMDGDEP